MDLYFLRHGLADDRADWTDNDDARPLTKPGKKRMADEAKALVHLKLNLDAIITSPLVRARQTADIVAKHLDAQDGVVEDKRLAPGFNLSKLREIIHEHENAQALMIVGHEPDFSATVGELIGRANIVMKKGGLAYVNVTSTSPLEGELVWLVPPKVLAGEEKQKRG